jgi:hypothetical protein
MKAIRNSSRALPAVLISSAFLLIPTSCSNVKKRVYTSAIDPVFLDDSTALVLLSDITETEKPLSAPRTTGVALRGYRVNYRMKSEIAAYFPSVDFGDLETSRFVSPVGDTLFITSTIFRNPFVLIHRVTGKVLLHTREICCLGLTGRWLQPGTYLSHDDSSAPVILSLPGGTTTRLQPDTIFGIQGAEWLDLRIEDGRIQAIAASGDSLIYMEKGLSDGILRRWALPAIPEPLQNYGKPLVVFAGNNDYIRLTAKLVGNLYYMLPLRTLKVDPANADWSEEQNWIFNENVSVKTKKVRNFGESHVDPAIVTFLDSGNIVLAEYDFSNLIRK